jgi:hypothetical protein
MSALLDTPPDDHRRCGRCHEDYSPSDLRATCGHYFEAPYRYADGFDEHCLACWLGVGRPDRDDPARTTP